MSIGIGGGGLGEGCLCQASNGQRQDEDALGVLGAGRGSSGLLVEQTGVDLGRVRLWIWDSSSSELVTDVADRGFRQEKKKDCGYGGGVGVKMEEKFGSHMHRCSFWLASAGACWSSIYPELVRTSNWTDDCLCSANGWI